MPVRKEAIVTYKSRPLANGSLSWFIVIRETDGTEKLIPRPEFTRPEDKPAMVALAARFRAALKKGMAEPPPETCNGWFDRYTTKAKAAGQTDAETRRTRWRKWFVRIHDKRMQDVTRDDVENIRDELDAAIAEYDRIGGKRSSKKDRAVAGKTAMNIWTAGTSAFKEAIDGKDRSLRVLAGKPNPFEGVKPPGDAASRKSRRKTFLYPVEAAALLSCEAIPVAWRECYALALYTYLRPGELRVLTLADLDTTINVVHVTKAWDYDDGKVKPPKTANGVRKVPIEPALRPLVERMKRRGSSAGLALAVPCLTAHGEDHLAEQFREHLKLAGIDRSELHVTTRTHAQSNFRSCRDSGITWLAMSGLGVDKIVRRAGHDQVQTSMGYIKLAEDIAGELGTPFAPLPDALTMASVKPPATEPTEPEPPRGGGLPVVEDEPEPAPEAAPAPAPETTTAAPDHEPIEVAPTSAREASSSSSLVASRGVRVSRARFSRRLRALGRGSNPFSRSTRRPPHSSWAGLSRFWT